MNLKQLLKFFILFSFVYLSFSFSKSLSDYSHEGYSLDTIMGLNFYLSECSENFLKRGFFDSSSYPFILFLQTLIKDTFEILNYKIENSLHTKAWLGQQLPKVREDYFEPLNNLVNSEDFDVEIVFQIINKLRVRETIINLAFAQKLEIREKKEFYFLGDLHGNYEEFINILLDLVTKDILDEKLKLKGNKKLIFLGDFVDRGLDGLDVFIILMLLKVINPKNVILLRGNHESIAIQTRDGFKGELEDKLGWQDGKIFWGLFACLYELLPEVLYLNCIGADGREFTYQCNHGGWNDDYDPIPLLTSVYLFNQIVYKVRELSTFRWNDISFLINMDFEPCRNGSAIVHNSKYILKNITKKGITGIIKGHDHYLSKIIFMTGKIIEIKKKLDEIEAAEVNDFYIILSEMGFNIADVETNLLLDCFNALMSLEINYDSKIFDIAKMFYSKHFFNFDMFDFLFDLKNIGCINIGTDINPIFVLISSSIYDRENLIIGYIPTYLKGYFDYENSKVSWDIVGCS